MFSVPLLPLPPPPLLPSVDFHDDDNSNAAAAVDDDHNGLGFPSSSTADMPSTLSLSSFDFPTPPSHIPPSPFTPPTNSPWSPRYSMTTPSSPPASFVSTASSVNPPPSLPPTAPLPPVPGPSPISPAEQLVLLARSTASRRSSRRISTHSSTAPPSSRRTSVASSVHSTVPSLSHSASFTTQPGSRPASLISEHSFLSVSHSAHNSKPPPLDLSIDEEDAPARPLMSEDELAPTTAARDRGNTGEIAATTTASPPSSPSSLTPLSVQALHHAMRAARSKSKAHRSALVSPSESASESSSAPTTPADSLEFLPASSSDGSASTATYYPQPIGRHDDDDIDGRERRPSEASIASASSSSASFLSEEPYSIRPDSPDVGVLVSKTPRPRKRASAATLSSTSSSRTSGRRSLGMDGARRRVSESGQMSFSSSGLAYDDDDEEEEEDYGRVIDRATGRFEEEVDDGGDSDSSLDIHTPLPHLMFRDGLLSPRSKLFAASPAPSRTGRPDSMLSTRTVGSTLTKSGVYRDERDTARRRTRHRDGRLLRGGIGLTTGLGWSDSEDEDAPSPLTRRLSAQTLARRRASEASSSMSTPHAGGGSRASSRLARSTSAGHPLRRNAAGASSPPPPSSYVAPPNRARTNSASSASVRARSHSGASSLRAAVGHASAPSSVQGHHGHTPSTLSTKSRAPGGAGPSSPVDGHASREKITPPSIPRRNGSTLDLRARDTAALSTPAPASAPATTVTTGSVPAYRARAVVAAESSAPAPAAAAVRGSAPGAKMAFYTRLPAAPRPLQLPLLGTPAPAAPTANATLTTTALASASAAAGTQASVAPRSVSLAAVAATATATNGVLKYNRQAQERHSAGTAPTVMASTLPARKPRTGTGMVYRRTSGGGVYTDRPSALRAPTSMGALRAAGTAV